MNLCIIAYCVLCICCCLLKLVSSVLIFVGTASAEEMPLELSDAKVRVESEELTSMADSTMKDGLGSADASGKC